MKLTSVTLGLAVFSYFFANAMKTTLFFPFARTLIHCDDASVVVPTTDAKNWSGSAFCGDTELVAREGQFLKSLGETSGVVLQAVMMPILGKFSDTHGRRKLLLLGSAGYAAQFFVYWMTASLPNIAGILFIIGAVVQGLTGVFPSTLYAMVADTTPSQNAGGERSKLYGLVQIVKTLGGGVGAVIATSIVALNLESYAVLWLCLGCVCISTVALSFCAPETLSEEKRATEKEGIGLHATAMLLLSRRSLAIYASTTFLLVLSLSSLATAQAFLTAKYHWTQIGSTLVLMGAGGVGVISLLSSFWIVPKLGSLRAFFVAVLLSTVGQGLMVLGAATSPLFFVAGLAVMFSGSFAAPAYLDLISSTVSDSDQGKVQAAISTLSLIAYAVGNLVFSWMIKQNLLVLPYIVGSCIGITATVLIGRAPSEENTNGVTVRVLGKIDNNPGGRKPQEKKKMNEEEEKEDREDREEKESDEQLLFRVVSCYVKKPDVFVVHRYPADADSEEGFWVQDFEQQHRFVPISKTCKPRIDAMRKELARVESLAEKLQSEVYTVKAEMEADAGLVERQRGHEAKLKPLERELALVHVQVSNLKREKEKEEKKGTAVYYNTMHTLGRHISEADMVVASEVKEDTNPEDEKASLKAHVARELKHACYTTSAAREAGWWRERGAHPSSMSALYAAMAAEATAAKWEARKYRSPVQPFDFQMGSSSHNHNIYNYNDNYNDNDTNHHSNSSSGRSIEEAVEKYRAKAAEDMRRLEERVRRKPPPPPGRPTRVQKKMVSPTRVQNALLESESRAVKYRQEIEALRRDSEMMKDRVRALTIELEEARQSSRDQTKTIAHLRRARDKFKPSMAAAEQQLDDANKRIAEQRATIARLKKRNKELKGKNEELLRVAKIGSENQSLQEHRMTTMIKDNVRLQNLSSTSFEAYATSILDEMGV
eukprot:g530.t1